VDVLAVASVGMKNDEARLKSIGHNLANVLTPGYKAQVTVLPTFSEQLRTAGGAGLGAGVAVASLDPSPGPLRHTGHASDVAIDGAAFFELAGPAGPTYTRQGSLRVDAQGRLVGPQGLPVMGVSGSEIRLENQPFTIAANGAVSQGGRVIGTIKLVKFDRPGLLEAQGNGTYRQGAASIEAQTVRATLRGGYIEGANVNSAQEMVRLAETVRHFEALHRLVQGYDETLEKAIRKLGEF